MFNQHLFSFFFLLLASFQYLIASPLHNIENNCTWNTKQSLVNCPILTILEENGPSCTSLGSVVLGLENVINGIYSIGYEGGTFENTEIINGQTTLYFTEEGTYHNLHIVINECTSAENPSIVIDPINTNILSLNILTDSSNCDTLGEVDFNVNGYSEEFYTLDYSWRNGEPSGDTGFRAISTIPVGSHFIAVTGDCYFFTDTLFLTISPSCTEVWPGDANHNGQVNQADALSIILKNGKSGPVRLNATTNWEGQLATDWNNIIPDDTDAKHADSNGDGTIDPYTDLLAVVQNYLDTIPNQPIPSENLFLNQDYTLTAERSEIQNLQDVTTVSFDLKLKNHTSQALEIAGLSFSAFYQNSTSPRLESSESELGILDENLFSFFHNSPNNRIDGAVGRMDGQNVMLQAFDSLIISSFIIDEDIVTLGTDQTNNNSISLNFSEILILNQQGDQYYIGGSTATFNSGNPTNLLTEPLAIAMTATYALDCPMAGTATIMPNGGIPPYEYMWENGQTTAHINALNPGTYYATLSDANADEIIGLIIVEGTTNCSTNLPIELLYFEATLNFSNILLTWATGPHINTKHFEIQRSTDGKIFNTIAYQTTNEETSANYQFKDDNIEPKQIYYYRLKMVGYGQFTFSNIIEVAAPPSLSGIDFFPNPVKDNLNIKFKQVLSKPSEIVVFNAYGQKIQELLVPQDLSQFILSFKAFSSGLYFVSIQVDGEVFSFNIIKE